MFLFILCFLLVTNKMSPRSLNVFLQKLKTNKKYNQPSFQLNNLHTTTLHMLTDIVSLYKPNRDVLGKINTYPYPKSKKSNHFFSLHL